MKFHTIRVMTLAAAMVLAVPALANPAEDAGKAEQDLEQARERLEAAAREVAELAAKVHGPGSREVIRLMIGGDEARKAMIGVSLDPGRVSPGARIVSVSPGGPAAEAGVQVGDVIVALDGKSLAGSQELTEAMSGVEPGQKLALDLKRDGRPVKVVVIARPMRRMLAMGDPDGPMHGAMARMPGMPGMPEMHMQHWLLDGFGEAEFVTLTPRLGSYFGTDKGVLVARAPQALGLEDGDVIVAIGGREPQNGPHAMRILRSYQPGEEIELRIMRDRKAQTLKVSAPTAEGTGKRIERRRVITAPPGKPPMPPAPPAPPADAS